MDATPAAAGPLSFGTAIVATGEGDAPVRSRRTPSEVIFRTVSDGGRHRLVDLAHAAFERTDTEAVAGVVEELVALRHFGLPSTLDATTVRAAPVAPLDAASIAVHLDRGPISWTVRVVHATGSTNSDLLSELRSGPPSLPILVAAEIQRAGRGRLGRTWASSIGRSLTCSFAIRVRRRLSELDGATLVCGLAVHDVFATCGVTAGLKWPNDIVVDDRKLAGILVEACPDGTSTILVVGIGANVMTDDSANEAAGLARTSLQQCGSRDLDRSALCARIALALGRELGAFETRGFAGFSSRWNDIDAFHDRSVRLTDVAATTVGIARGVDDHGALLIDVAGARRRVIAGDVSLRPADASYRVPSA